MQKLIIISLILLMITGIALGQVPQLINYQGLLIDPDTGQSVSDSTYEIIFSIYNSPTGGSAIWTETRNVSTKNGLYSVLLGSNTPISSTILTSPEKYLGIKVEPEPEMTPRKRIVSVAYAILSGDADKVDGKHATAFAESVHVHDNRYYTESELNTSDGDPPNQGSNRISWDNLNDVPAGFADGVDDTSSGSGGGGWTDSGTNVYLTTSTDKVGIGDTSPTHKLDVAGKIGINDTQVLFLPDQTDFAGTLYLGDGGGSLSSSSYEEGDYNTAMGIGALYANTSGFYNTACGNKALYYNTSGVVNTASGASALHSNITGSANTASGYYALGSNTTGRNNTSSGHLALVSNITGSNNTAIGFHADVGSGNLTNATAIGANAIVATSNSMVLGGTGENAVKVGIGTTSPDEQLEITGNFKLPTTTTTTGIIMSGGSRFIHNFGFANFFAGVNAGNLTTSGSQNTAIGQNAMTSNTSGSFNAAVGDMALMNNTTGSTNTAIGDQALVSNTTGYSNTVVGYNADVGYENLHNANAFGAGAIVNSSNAIQLGNNLISSLRCQVDLTVVSDSTKKENFLQLDGEEVLKKISRFQLGSWNFKGHDPSKFRHYGPMAQDFFAAFGHDRIGTIGTDTTICGSDIDGINMIAIQALEKRTEELKAKTQELVFLKEQMRVLKALVLEQNDALNRLRSELAGLNETGLRAPDFH